MQKIGRGVLYSNSCIGQNDANFFSSQDEVLLSPFYKICNRISLFRQTWIIDVLVDTSIKIKVSTETNIIGLKKGLDFAPIQSKINELE